MCKSSCSLYCIYIFSFLYYDSFNLPSISTSFVYVYVPISIHICYLLSLGAYYVFRRAYRVAKTLTFHTPPLPTTCACALMYTSHLLRTTLLSTSAPLHFPLFSLLFLCTFSHVHVQVIAHPRSCPSHSFIPPLPEIFTASSRGKL